MTKMKRKIIIAVVVVVVVLAAQDVYAALMNAAIKAGNRDAIEVLIQLPADLNRENRAYGWFDNPNMRGHSPMEYLCFYGDVDLAELFASRESGFSPRAATKMLFYVLQSANPNKLEMTKYFVEKGADVNEVRFGESALTQNFARHTYANDSERQLANEQQYETMLYLIRSGAMFEIDGAIWDHILVRASACGNMRAVEYILAADIVDVDHAVASGDTALMRASEMGYEDVVRLLLDNGADASVRNRGGKTALDYVRENGHEDVVRLLEGA